MTGLDPSAAAYFNKRLNDHISYLMEHDLLDARQEERIRTAFSKAVPLLDSVKGSLLHRDYAYWNILGTPDTIERVIDWDDSVSGDPADDFGIVNCFLPPELLEQILKSYTEIREIDDSFRIRIHMHTVRNMLWKAMIRHYMGYFDMGRDFFLTGPGGMPLKEYTLYKINTELTTLENLL
jgi:aminoglycoside phosphotransferase (APT) family kinase protein